MKGKTRLRGPEKEAQKAVDLDLRIVQRIQDFDEATRPAARFQKGRRNFHRWIAPGIWQDVGEAVHFDLDWMLFALELPASAENIQGAERMMDHMLCESNPEMAKRERIIDR